MSSSKRLLGDAALPLLVVAVVISAAKAFLAVGGRSPATEPLRARYYCNAGDTFVRLSYLVGYRNTSYEVRLWLLEQASSRYLLAHESVPNCPTYALSLALTRAAMGYRKQAARTLSSAVLSADKRRSKELRPVLLVLRPDRPRPEWIEGASRELQWNVSGFALLADAYRRAGRPDLAEGQEERMNGEGRKVRRPLVTTAAICGFILACGLVGVVWAPVSLMRRRRGAGAREVAEGTAGAGWSVRVATETVVVYLCLQAVMAWAAGPALGSSAWRKVLMLGGSAVLSGGGALLWAKLRSPRGARLGWSFSGALRQSAGGLAMAGVAVVPLMALGQVIGLWTHARPLDDPVLSTIVGTFGGVPKWVTAVLVCVVAPTLEESVFRGVVYQAVRARGSFLCAAAVSGLVFAAGHGSIGVGAPMFLLGMGLAYLYERHRSLLAPTVAHAAFNAFNLAIIAFIYGAGAP